MEILTNKKEIINSFERIFDEIIISKETKLSDITKKIRTKMLDIGIKIFENWFYANIGTGYSKSKIFSKVNGKMQILKFHNYLSKRYITCLGEVELKRAYYKNKDNTYFPIEEKNEWLKDDYLPDVKELSCYVSMLEPYNMASEMLEKVGGIKISSSSLQKITKSIGSELVKLEDENVNNPTKYNDNNKEMDLLVVSYDGTCINTENDWKEVKSCALYQVKKDKYNELHACKKSYISRIENCKDFGKRIYKESIRRNIVNAKKVVTIGDGAKWIWEISNNYFPNAIEIVDWYHSAEHLWKIIELMYGDRGNEEGKIFEKFCEDILYNGLILMVEEYILDKLKLLKIKEGSERYKNILKELNYFKINEKRMKYKYFETQGFPIGSGVIEGACKHLVQLRMKRSGMIWSNDGAHDILQLRSLYFSNRWNEVENVIEKRCA